MTDFKKIYADIGRSYETTNHVLTLGLDILWRRRAVVEALAESPSPPFLDLCAGTGETAWMLSAGEPDVMVAAADFSLEMLEEGRRRRPGSSAVPVAAGADALPFESGTFGLVTITFAARNLDSRRGLLVASLREALRVLRPGGTFLCLETSRPPLRPVRWLMDLYTRIVPAAGRLLTGEGAGYAYLAGSIRRFHGAPSLAGVIESAGFAGVGWERLLLGAAAIHTARKP